MYNHETQRYSIKLKPLSVELFCQIRRQCAKMGDKGVEEQDIKDFINNTSHYTYIEEKWDIIETKYVLPGEMVRLDCDETSVSLLRLSNRHWLVVNSDNEEMFELGSYVETSNDLIFHVNHKTKINDFEMMVNGCYFEIPGKYHRIMDLMLLDNISVTKQTCDIYELYNKLVDYHKQQILENNFTEICNLFSDSGQSTFVMRRMLDSITLRNR